MMAAGGASSLTPSPRSAAAAPASRTANAIVLYGELTAHLPSVLDTLDGAKVTLAEPPVVRPGQSFGFLVLDERVDTTRLAASLSTACEPHVTAEPVRSFVPGRDPRTHDADSAFKNSVLILKNIPFQLPQEALTEMLSALPERPTSVAYHYDNSKTFRGMAFVKYRNADAARVVFPHIASLVIRGRRIRVEYKRKTTGHSRSASFSSNSRRPTVNSDACSACTAPLVVGAMFCAMCGKAA